jgi:putative oxidoreductase
VINKVKNCFKVSEFSPRISVALLLVRLVMGAAFLLHGWGKMQAPFSWMPPEAPIPGILQFLAAFSEFGGGAALLLGALVPLAMLGLTFTMFVATMMHMFVMKDPFVASGPGMGSYEPALTYLVLAIFFITAGPGKFSVDAKIFGTRR